MPNILFRIRNKVKVKAGNEIELGPSTRVRQCQISIKGSGNKLVIKDGANLKGVQIELDGRNYTLVIGENCVIGEGCYLSARENNTSRRINYAKDIQIDDRVWLADGAVVLKGSNIGSGSVVGINSVVTKSVPENSIATGNPARTVKSNIIWDEKLTY